MLHQEQVNGALFGNGRSAAKALGVRLAVFMLTMFNGSPALLRTVYAQGNVRGIGDVHVGNSQPGILELSWDPPSETPLDYRVSWAPAGEDFPSENDDQGNAYPTSPAYTIAGLAEGECYKVRLRARYGDGAGDWTRPVVSVVQVSPPTNTPTLMPTEAPTNTPTLVPTEAPTDTPTLVPTEAQTDTPTLMPAEAPTNTPTLVPTEAPTDTPTLMPTEEPTGTPTPMPTEAPTNTPTLVPTEEPTGTPTLMPTEEPTDTSTLVPTEEPTDTPTLMPTALQADTPTLLPAEAPTDTSTLMPTEEATGTPMLMPTEETTNTSTLVPTETLTDTPTLVPTALQTGTPTLVPAAVQTDTPTLTPAATPTCNPTPATSESVVLSSPGGICDRTLQVRSSIIGLLNSKNLGSLNIQHCNEVTDENLTRIFAVDLTGGGVGSPLTSLQAGDFDGLTGLNDLILQGNNLRDLPADVFDGL